jgi:hypothetical protein
MGRSPQPELFEYLREKNARHFKPESALPIKLNGFSLVSLALLLKLIFVQLIANEGKKAKLSLRLTN